MNAPYLTFVLGSRNDDYAGAMPLRLQTTLESLVGQLEKYGPDAEIIIIEWNPPEDRPSLAEALHFPETADRVTIRIISVDAAYHRRYKDWRIKPIHIGVVYNVGIRRARGRFIAHRASDAFYSESLARYFAQCDLSEDHVYRCDRYDVDESVLEDGAAGLQNAESKIVRRHARLETPDYFDIRDLHTNACGDFILMSKRWWSVIRGRYESPSVLTADLDSLVLHAVCAAGAVELELPLDCRVYKIAHKSLFALNVEQQWNPFLKVLDSLVGHGFSIRSQLHMRSVLNYPKRRLRGREGLVLDSFEKNFLAGARKWARGEGPYYLNAEDWGLAGVDLPERRVCKARWDEEKADRHSRERGSENREETDAR